MVPLPGHIPGGPLQAPDFGKLSGEGTSTLLSPPLSLLPGDALVSAAGLTSKQLANIFHSSGLIS